MARKHFWKMQYSVTIFVILGVLLMLAPVSVDTSRQAFFITKWKETFSRIDYTLKVIQTHISDDMIKNFKMAKSSEEKEALVLMVLKPYLRLTPAKFGKKYKITYMNGSKVHKTDDWAFKEYYTSDNGVIVGIKDLSSANPKDPIFLMMFDINGVLLPNTWGKDIFGLIIYRDRHVAVGAEQSTDKLPQDCSVSGSGLFCSYYYLIGGEFDD